MRFQDNKWFNRLRALVEIILPAFATFYATLGDTWGFPYTDEVVNTIVAVTVFLGCFVEISRRIYNKSLSEEAIDGVQAEIEDTPEGE